MKLAAARMVGAKIRQLAKKFAKVYFGENAVSLKLKFLFQKKFGMIKITIFKSNSAGRARNESANPAEIFRI